MKQYKTSWSLFVALLMLTFCCRSPKLIKNRKSPTSVILKLDDLWNEKGLIHPGWRSVFDFLNEKNIVGTIGIVGESLEDGSPEYFQWIKDRHAEGHEIWNHGYCHCKPMVNGEERREFRGTDYTYQLEQIQKTQALGKEKLGITFKAFGAPYNSTDSLTAQILEKMTEIKTWMYKESKTPSSKHIYNRISDVNIEYPVHVPDFEKFKEGYEIHKTEPLLVIQGHPRSWMEQPERMEAFKKIVLFLKKEGVVFTTPYDYYLKQK